MTIIIQKLPKPIHVFIVDKSNYEARYNNLLSKI